MRIFANTQEAFPEILRDIVKNGILNKSNSQQDQENVGDDYLSKELTAYSFMVEDPSDSVENAHHPDWVKREIIERTNTQVPWVNPGTNYLTREYWNNYIYTNARGKSIFPYAYNERMGPYLEKVVNLLLENPSTRQAILALWRQDIDGDRVNGVSRIPCSMYYNFQIRGDVLTVIYHMRSCDYFEHFRNDFALAYLIGDWVAHELKALGRPGSFPPTAARFQDLKVKVIMSMDSLHAYKKDWGHLEIY
jgi:thymidylate synthase